MSMTASEICIAVKMTGTKSYGHYTFLLRSGLVTPPPIEEIRARLVTDKKKEPEKHMNKAVICYDLKGEFVASYESVKAASEKVGVKTHCIYDCCVGKAKTSRGFQWRYAEDDPPGVYEKPKSAPVKLPKKKPLQDRVCAVCGKIFQGHKGECYCSDECRKEGRRTLARERWKAKPKEEKTLICEYCGNPFTVTDARSHRFCSIRCRETYHWKATEARKREQRKAQNRK